MADILKAKDFVRVRLTRNGMNLYDQAFTGEEEDFTEVTSERAVLGTNMSTSQAVSLGGVSTGRRIMVETDREILVGLGITPANKITVQEVMIMVGSFSHLWVRNTGTQEARLTYVVTD